MAVVSADYKFLYVDVSCNVRVSNGGVFHNCSLFIVIFPDQSHYGRLCIPVPYDIVTNDAFPPKIYVMKSFPFWNEPLQIVFVIIEFLELAELYKNSNCFLFVFAFRKYTELFPAKEVNFVLAVFWLSDKSLTRYYAPQERTRKPYSRKELTQNP